MYRSENVIRGNFVGKIALLALIATAALCLGAPHMALGQVPGAVFSYANGIGGIDGYGGTVSHIAANNRGDVFVGSVNGSFASVEEYPAGSTTAVTLISGLDKNPYGSGNNGNVGIAVDAAGNVYAADPGESQIIFIPFVNGSYPTGATLSGITYCASGNFPYASATQTSACIGKQYWPSYFGYSLQFIDVAFDGSGNMYTLSKYTGTYQTSWTGGQNMIVEWPASAPGSYTLLADNLPQQSNAEIAVDKAGDIYYVDTTTSSTIQYMAAGSTVVTAETASQTNSLPGTFGSGFTHPTGVSIDASGNVYVTDEIAISGSASNRIVEFPSINGTVSAANQYTLSNEISSGNSNLTNTSNNEYGPSTGVGVDSYGNLYYAGAFPNSLNEAIIGKATFGAQPINTTSGSQTLNLSFTSTVTFGSLSVSGPFAASATTCAAQQYTTDTVCTVSVTYTPTAVGPQSGVIKALDNSGNTLGSLALSGSGTAALLNIDPGTESAVGTTWTAPGAIAVDAQGNTYVADSGKIYKTAAGGGTPVAVVTGLSSPTAVAIDAAGNLYVADTGTSSNQVVEVPYASSAYGAPIVLVSSLSGPSGLALDAQGNLYVADSGNARVLQLSSSGDQGIGSLMTTVSGAFTAPVAVAVDNLGNLYVSDAGAKKVFQIALATSKQTTILSGMTTPAGVAVDAAGSLYAADAGAGTITRVPNISSALVTGQASIISAALLTAINHPTGIAFDSAGKLYVTDATDASATKVDRTAGVLNFGGVDENATSAPMTADLTNSGTSALTFNTPYFTNSGADAADFAEGSSTCANGGTVNTGAFCTVLAKFTPGALGALTETWNLQSNAQDSPVITLKGTGVTNLISTSVGLAVTAPAGTPVYGQSVTVTATVTPGTGPTGNVTFFVDSIQQTPNVSLASGAASITLTGLAGGAHTISATYNGDTSYATSNNSLPLTVNPAPTATTTVSITSTSPLGSNPISATVGASITFTATVTPTVAGTLAGTVTFYNGATSLATGVTVSQSGNGAGVVTFTTSALTAGSYSVTATYVGDSNNAASNSAAAVALQINPPAPYAGPGVVFSQAFPITYFSPTVSHLAANSRGDVFVGTGTTVEEYPVGSTNSVTLVSGLGGGGNSGIAVDAAGNVYAADPGDQKIIFVPFVNGSYPSGATFGSLSQCGSNGNFPFASPAQTKACSGFGGIPGYFGYYLKYNDVALDGSGNLYTLSSYTGTYGTSWSGGQNMIIEWSASTGSYTLLADNLPDQGGAEIAVDKAGNVYYVDTTSRSTIQYLAAGTAAVTAETAPQTNSLPGTFGSGFTQPTGVSIDSSGNLYVTDQSAKSLVEFPNINGSIVASNQYTLSNALNTSQTSGPNEGVAVDGYGRVTYAGSYPNSLNYVLFGQASFGAQAMGTTSGSQSMNVSFAAPATFGSFVVTGPFAQTNTCSGAYTANQVCTVSVTYTPTAAGPQSGLLTALDNSGKVLGTAQLSGNGQEPVLEVDPGTVAAIGTSWSAPSAVAVDAAGNTYVADGGSIYKTAPGGTPAAIVNSLNAPASVVVDAAGNLYVAETGTSSNQVAEVPYANSAYGTPMVLLTGLSGASGLALDAQGNLYVADSGNARVLWLSRGGNLLLGSLVSTVSGTFTKPVAVAVDNLGNLYVSDAGSNKVVQIALATSTQTTILSGLTTASGVAVDAGGSLYAADAGAGTVTRVPNVGGAINTSLNPPVTLTTVVAKPSAIAVDGNGNVYAADVTNKAVAALNRNLGSLNLGNINVLASSAAIAANVTDGGTAALTFGSSVITAGGADSGDFAFQSSSTCAASGSINAGTSCTVAAVFTPQAQGARSATWSFQSNAQDSASLALKGKGASLAVTSLALAVTAPVETPAYGQSVTVTATITPGTGPTGNVTFYVDSIAQTPNVAIASGSASITLSGLAGGAHTIAATYNGDTAFASSNNSLPVTVNPAATATSVVTLSSVPPLGTNPTSATLGSSITLSATVTPSAAGNLTGTVTFLNGNTVLASGVAATQATVGGPGLATFTTSTLTPATYSITASYTGDVDFATSASASSASLVINAPPPNTTAAIFSSTGYVSAVNGAPGSSPFNYQGSAGHLAGNSRGDIFFVDAPYSFPATAYLQEVPAAGGSQTTLLTGLGYGSNGVFSDTGNNLWVGDEAGNIIYIPFVNGSYASGNAVSSLTGCTAPITSNTVPCKFFWQLTATVGSYVQPSDIALDGSGNVYVVDKYDGATSGSKNRILEFAAADGTMTMLVDGLPSVGGAQLAVDPAGDVYYADGNGVYYFTAASFPTTTGTAAATSIGTGLSNPTGVALDTGGNLYISDTGNARLLEIPYENGSISTANQYVLTSGAQMSSNHAQSGAGIDGYGNIYYVGNYGNSINHLTVGNFALGYTGVGTATGASSLDLYFLSPATFGSFTVSGGAGAFAVGTNGCTQGKTYAAGTECTVSVTYTATAAGLQTGAISAWNNNGTLLGQAVLSGTGMAPLLNVDPGTVTAIGTTWAAPSAVAVDASGNSYVADAGKIYMTTPGGTPAVVASGFSNPSAVLIDGAGNLYVGDSGNNQVVELPYINSLYGTPIVLATGLKGASGLALDQANNLYIADSGNARVLLVARSGNLQAQSLVSTVGSGFTTPVAVAADTAGNLYVSDAGSNKVVQIAIPTSLQTTVLSGLTSAAGVAVDAGGSLYAADAGSGTLYRIPTISGLLNKNFQSAMEGLVAKPNAIALDSNGNLYVADAADASVVEVNRSAGALNFGNVNVLDSSSAVSANVSDGGTTQLTLNSPYYTASGTGMASFAVQSSSTCAASSINPGANCTVAAIFTPQTKGLQSETLTFSGNALNSSALTLNGNGTHLTTSTLAIAVTSPIGNPAFGQTVTVSATLTPNAGGAGTPTGTVTFYVDTVPQTPVPLTNNAASIALTGLLGGQHVISASYSGDNNFASAASTNLNLTVNTAATATGSVTLVATPPLWTDPISINVGATITLGAMVSNSIDGIPTGTVTFLNGSTVLGTGPVNGSGMASFTTSSLTAGSYNITATYSGDSNFNASTSSTSVALLVSPPTITMATSTPNIVGGGAPVTLTFNAIAGFAQTTGGPGTISLACNGLPAYASCSFTPPYVTFPTGSLSQQVSLQVVVNQPPPIVPSQSGIAAIPHLPGRPALEAFMGLCLLLPSLFLGLARKRALRVASSVWRTTALLLLLMGGCLLGTSGCGSSSSATFTTPPGSSKFTVTATITPATAAPNPPPVQTIQFTLTVN
ncbi:MAG: Ig-like domain repeat protein [Terracidiphilus sp.]